MPGEELVTLPKPAPALETVKVWDDRLNIALMDLAANMETVQVVLPVSRQPPDQP